MPLFVASLILYWIQSNVTYNNSTLLLIVQRKSKSKQSVKFAIYQKKSTNQKIAENVALTVYSNEVNFALEHIFLEDCSLQLDIIFA